jgi:hypothetical protein
MVIFLSILVWVLVGLSIQNFALNLIGREEYSRQISGLLSIVFVAVVLWPVFLVANILRKS